MITENILNDFKLYTDWGLGIDSKIYRFELQHQIIPIRFELLLEIKTSAKLTIDAYLAAINSLYQNVVSSALHNKPDLPTTGWHTINYVPYWCKEKQRWCCLGRNGKEIFDEESAKINDFWDELNMQ